ncbi:MAG: septum formation initiator family protein [Pseudomonadota bacterium]
MHRPPRDQLKQGMALMVLLVLTGLAIAGPTGLLAWNENANLLEQRKNQIALLTAERNELRNRVDLLDPGAADPDLVGELLRRNMNVVHPDEVVITVEDE